MNLSFLSGFSGVLFALKVVNSHHSHRLPNDGGDMEIPDGQDHRVDVNNGDTEVEASESDDDAGVPNGSNISDVPTATAEEVGDAVNSPTSPASRSVASPALPDEEDRRPELEELDGPTKRQRLEAIFC